MADLKITVNGRIIRQQVEPRLSLADFLRDDLQLTALHLGCEQGVCGACTILIDGKPIRSCLRPAVACGDRDVTTLEGLAGDKLTEELREAFAENHGLQCGYCTPGMLITARDIVERLPGADEERIRLELSGNLCRCTGYQGIVDAIASVIARRGHPRGQDNDKSISEQA